MPIIITAANEKGGVGRTTTVVNLAAVFASMGKSVLVVDNDPQGNSTRLLGVERSNLGSQTLCQAMLDKAPCDDYVVGTNINGVSLLAATPRLRRVINELGNGYWQDMLLKKVFDTKKLDEYDFVLIDTHGSLDCLLKSSLAVSHYCLIPVFAEPDSTCALPDLLEILSDMREAHNHRLSLLGILVTKYDNGSPINREYMEEIKRVGTEAKVRIFANTIPTSVSVKNASRDQKSLLEFCISLPVSQAYIALGGELITILEEESLAREAIPYTEISEPELEEESTDFSTRETEIGPPAESPGYFYTSLRLLNRNFVLLWLGQAVSQLGSQVYVIAVIFWIKRATNSASLIASMLMVSGILNIILSGVGGTFADRHSRRKIIIYCDIVRGILVLSLAGLLYLAPHATQIIILWLMGVTVCMSVSVAFFNPALSAAIPDLVPHDEIRRANSLRQLTAQLALFVGQGLGGTLFRLWGAPLLILINGLSFLFAALTESFIKIPQAIPENSGTQKKQIKSFKEDIVEGLRYIWKNGGMRRLFFFSAIFNFFTMPIIVLMPFYVEDFLKVQLDWYGYLLAVFGAGILIGSLSAGFIKLRGKARARVMIAFAIINSIIIGLLGFVTTLKAAVILAFVIGTMGAFNGVNITAILQLTTPSEIRGRVFGLLHTLSGSIAPVGMGLGGIIYDLIDRNITLIYGGCGAMMVLLSILISMSRVFREFIAYEQPKASG